MQLEHLIDVSVVEQASARRPSVGMPMRRKSVDKQVLHCVVSAGSVEYSVCFVCLCRSVWDVQYVYAILWSLCRKFN